MNAGAGQLAAGSLGRYLAGATEMSQGYSTGASVQSQRQQAQPLRSSALQLRGAQLVAVEAAEKLRKAVMFPPVELRDLLPRGDVRFERVMGAHIATLQEHHAWFLQALQALRQAEASAEAQQNLPGVEP